MEELHRQSIQSGLRELKQIDYLKLSKVLIEAGIIDNSFVDRIKCDPKFPTEDQKAEEFFLKYTTRGPDAFGQLLQALHYCGFTREANSLERRGKEKNLVSIVRKSSISSLESSSENESLSYSSGKNGIPNLQPSNSSSISSSSMECEKISNSSEFGGRVPELANLSISNGQAPSIKKATIYNGGKSNEEEAYKMMSKPRGYALIVNNVEFEGDPDAIRKGADCDTDNLSSLLRDLGFEIFVKPNVKRQELENRTDGIIKEFQDMFNHKDVDCCVVALMSHGSEGTFRTCDKGDVHMSIYDDIVMRFNNVNCPALFGKPKIFIVQACRGSFRDKGFRKTECDVRASQQPEIPTPVSSMQEDYIRPSTEDIIICYSTVPGCVSNRDTMYGTWYIRTLCEVFREYAHDHELMALLRKVGREMGEHRSELFEKQMCSFKNVGFNKELYFNPSLFA